MVTCGVSVFDYDTVMKILTPQTGNSCFGCGADNRFGLQLTFHGDEETAQAWTEFTPPSWMNGAPNMMHGGFISLLLDEISSKVLSVLGKSGLTRNLDVSFETPVYLGQPIRLEAELIEHDARKHFIDARILDMDGEVLARSKALFLSLIHI